MSKKTLSSIEALQVRKDFLFQHGFLPRDFAIEEWIDETLLREARRMARECAVKASKPEIVAA